MIGAAGLKGPGLSVAIVRQRLAAVPRCTRSVCCFCKLRVSEVEVDWFRRYHPFGRSVFASLAKEAN